MVCIALINKLPENWTWIEVLWLPKPEIEQTSTALVTLILKEAARRDSEHLEDQLPRTSSSAVDTAAGESVI